MAPVRIFTPATGPQLFVFGKRCHHGLTGCALAVSGAVSGNRLLLVVGLALMIHDRHDWRQWV